MTNLETLADQINNFDLYYTQGSNATFMSVQPTCDAIRRELAALTTDEMIALRALISVEDKHLHFCFYEFKDLPKKAVAAKRSRVMSSAWALFRGGVATFSEALRMAWKRSKLVNKLRTGVAYFSYIKADGSERTAIGSLRNGNFEYKAKTNGKPENIAIVKYFDLLAKGFRSCRVDRLLTVA